MANPNTAHKASPAKIFETLNAYHQTASLKAAIELDLFTAIADGAHEPKTIASRVNASPKGVRVLCDFLVIHGFLQKEHGKYQLSEESAIFLSKHSPGYLGTIIGFLSHDWHLNHYSKLTDIVRHGGALDGDGDNTRPNDEAWFRLRRADGTDDGSLGPLHFRITRRKIGKTCQGARYCSWSWHFRSYLRQAQPECAHYGSRLAGRS